LYQFLFDIQQSKIEIHPMSLYECEPGEGGEFSTAVA
jgi:hypothetical protein